MKSVLTGTIARVAIVACGFFFGLPAFAQSTFGFSSVSGDPVGQGQTSAYATNTADFTLLDGRANQRQVVLTVDGHNGDSWQVTIIQPDPDRLEAGSGGGGQVELMPWNRTTPYAYGLIPGSYPRADRLARGRAPGLSVERNGVKCEEVWGELNIMQATYFRNQLRTLEASFIQRCNGENAPPLAGFLRYRAPRLSFSAAGGAGNEILDGDTGNRYSDKSKFSLSGEYSTLTYSASGEREDWMVAIDLDSPTQLLPGDYAFGPADKTISVRRWQAYQANGQPDAIKCSASDDLGFGGAHGVLRVKNVQYNRVYAPRPTRLYADLEYACQGNPSVLKLKIHYLL